jgi:hypothetical protein
VDLGYAVICKGVFVYGKVGRLEGKTGYIGTREASFAVVKVGEHCFDTTEPAAVSRTKYSPAVCLPRAITQ